MDAETSGLFIVYQLSVTTPSGVDICKQNYANPDSLINYSCDAFLQCTQRAAKAINTMLIV